MVPRITLTPDELRLCVTLISRGRTLAHAIDRVQAQRCPLFHALLVHPATGARLDAMLADNRRVDAALAAVAATKPEDRS